MDEVEKIEHELDIIRINRGTLWPDEIARFVMRREIEARIDEIELNMTCDSERLNKIRLAELRKELIKLLWENHCKD